MVSRLTLYRTFKLLFWVDSIFYSFSHQCVRSPGAPHSHQHFYWVFNFMGVHWYLTVVLICTSSFRTTDVEHLIMYLSAICRASVKWPFKSLPDKNMWVVCSLVVRLLYISWVQVFIRCIKYFLRACDFLIFLYISVLWKAVFNFDEINLPIFPFMVCAFCILSKKSLPTPKAVEIFFSNFFSLAFMFRPMIRLKFVSACSMR